MDRVLLLLNTFQKIRQLLWFHALFSIDSSFLLLAAASTRFWQGMG
jgi:hypothetical protein